MQMRKSAVESIPSTLCHYPDAQVVGSYTYKYPNTNLPECGENQAPWLDKTLVGLVGHASTH